MNPKNHWVNNYISLVILRVTKLKPAFLGCFCYWPNSFMKGDEGGIFSKAPDWKTLFLLKIKIKQNSGCPKKEWKCCLQTLLSEY